MKIKKELIKRSIAGETVLVPVGRTVYEANGLFVLNELGDFLWERLPEAENEEQLLACILEEYEVDEETARRDLLAFLDKLKQMEIL